jgi:HK97 family phage major capsid protein
MLIAELKTALDGFKAEVLDKIKADQTVTAEKLAATEKALDEKIKKTIDAEMTARRLSLPGLETEKKKFRFAEVIKAQINNGQWDAEAGFEKEVCENTAKLRSANASSGEAGGYLIPDEITSELIQMAIAQMPVLELGPTIMQGLRGELPIPSVTGRPAGYWVAEESAPTESNSTFGEVTMRPKTLGAFTKISRRLLQQSAGLAETTIRGLLTDAMRIALETALIRGSGSEAQPKGIINYAGLTSTVAIGTNGGRFILDKATEMIANIDEADLLSSIGRFGFLMRPMVKFGMKTERVAQWNGQAASAGMPTINPLVTDAALEQLLGYKIRTTTLISKTLTKGNSSTCSHVIFGDFSQLILGMWEGFEFKASDTAGNASGSAMTQRQIWLTAFQSVDIAMKNAAAFTMLADAETTKSSW